MAKEKKKADSRQCAEMKYCQISSATEPFVFADGRSADPILLAYQTWGELNTARDNAVLVFHALSGSSNIAGRNTQGPRNEFWTEECHDGWWDDFVGPGKGIDTRKYFVICANYPGGCYGSSGPSTIDPKTGKPWGSRFPSPSMTDIAEANARLLDKLGIKTLLGVVGASLGGFCALDFAARYPRRVRCVIPIATGVRTTVLSKAHNFEQIYAIEQDPNFRGGDYYDGARPNSGLTLARIISHKTFVSLALMESRARKAIIQPDDYLSGYRLQHQVESYILHQGRKFVRRFDANTYLRIINAWQSFDLPGSLAEGNLTKALSRCHGQEWLIFSISSDVCFYPAEQSEIATALNANRIDYQHITVHSEKGHDSFLLEPDLYCPYMSYKLDQAHRRQQDDADDEGDPQFTI